MGETNDDHRPPLEERNAENKDDGPSSVSRPGVVLAAFVASEPRRKTSGTRPLAGAPSANSCSQHSGQKVTSSPVPVRVDVRPELLVWARDRAGLSTDDLAHRFPRLFEWEAGLLAPTLKQLESFANALGYLFLQEPPDEPLPIPDYRTMGGARPVRPSPDLLDTIFLCQQRQEWYRGFIEDAGEDAVPFVGEFGSSRMNALSPPKRLERSECASSSRTLRLPGARVLLKDPQRLFPVVGAG